MIEVPDERDVAREDQRQAAAAESDRLIRCMGLLSGAEPTLHEPGKPWRSPTAKRVFDQWVESINGDGPKGLCVHLRESDSPQPYGGFPFMPGGLFCLQCIVAVVLKMLEPDFEGAIPCPGCNLGAPLMWGTITTGMHTLYYGLCRACQAEDEFAGS